MPRFNNVNGVDVQLTAAEETARDLEEAQYAAKQLALVSTKYARDRKDKYDLLNQDELRFDDLENNTTTWQDAINAIKADYPKP